MTNNIRRNLLLLLIIGLAAIMTACSWGNKQSGTGGNENRSDNRDSQVETETPQPAVNGEIIQIGDTSLLVTAYVTRDAQSFIDAYTLRVNEQTEIVDADGSEIRFDELKVGTRVETWSVGPVAESYPLQATAAKIIVLEDDATTQVSRADAVRIAIDAQTEIGGAWAVQDAQLDDEKLNWHIVIVHFMHQEEPVRLRIDAESGEILPNIVAENEAFRVYTPHPDSEAGPIITVKGEARVFEGNFAWILEDGHAILDEGFVQTDGAPAWGRFQFEASFEKASQPNMMLILFVHSAKDGSMENELVIPLRVPEELIEYSAPE